MNAYINDLISSMPRCFWASQVDVSGGEGLVLSVLGVVKDVSWGLSCPFHCSGSVLPSLALGLVLGFLSGLGFGLFLAWLALKHLAYPIPLTSPSPRKKNVRSRLRGYLHEQ